MLEELKFWLVQLSVFRARLARKLYEHMRREDASLRIQKHARALSARISYTKLQRAAMVIQTGLRAMAARNEFRRRKQNKGAIIIQTRWRSFHALSTYKRLKKCSISLQCLWRAKIARKELRKLKMDSEVTPPVLTKQRSLTDKQQENHDALIKCLLEDKRFDKNRSVAACIVYKTLLQWRSFEADKTNIFDRIIHMQNHDSTKALAYWLSTTSTLLFLLHRTIKASNTSSVASKRNRSSPMMLFGRMAQVRSSSMITGLSSDYSGMEGNPIAKSRIVIAIWAPVVLVCNQIYSFDKRFSC